MVRQARIVVPGYPHHITQRGNNKQKVFLENEDYRNYLALFEKYSAKHNLDIIGYCLMPNHIHFAAVPASPETLAHVIRCTNMRYSQIFNTKYDRVGHLWQGRFFSCTMDETHLFAALRYIENNPVRAKLVETAKDWKWSSAREHLGIDKSVLPLSKSGYLLDIVDWKTYLQEEEPEELTSEIKKLTLLGKPLGNLEFINKLKITFGEKVLRHPPGRPRKTGDGDLFSGK